MLVILVLAVSYAGYQLAPFCFAGESPTIARDSGLAKYANRNDKDLLIKIRQG